MNLEQFHEASARTAPVGLAHAELCKNAAWGLIGEFGEVVDLKKKIEFQGKGDCEKGAEWIALERLSSCDISADEGAQIKRRMLQLIDEVPSMMREELGDVFWYLSQVARCVGCDLRTTSRVRPEEPTLIDVACRVAFMGASLQIGTAHRDDVNYLVSDMCALIYAEGFTLSEVLQGNVDKLQARYPGGFSVEASRNRAA